MAIDMTMAEPKNTDVFVSIDIVHPQLQPDLKKPAIFVKGSQENFQTYSFLDDLGADYDVNSSVYKLAETMFGQNDVPEAVNVVTYSDQLVAPLINPNGQSTVDATNNSTVVDASGNNKTIDATNNNNNSKDLTNIFKDVGNEPSAGIKRAVYDYFYNDWEFALLADYNKQDALDLATMIDHGGYDGKGFHMFFLQFDQSNINDSLEFKKFNRTWTLYHTDPTERYDGALVAEASYGNVGQVDWKFVSNLQGITPESLKAVQIQELRRNNLICYVQKADNANQTDALNAQGWYIDTIHGADFLKSTVERRMQNAMGSNTGQKVFPYTAQGLSAIRSNLEDSFKLCGDQGIIATGTDGKYQYQVNVPNIQNVPIANVQHRVLRGVTASVTASSSVGEIHINIKETA